MPFVDDYSEEEQKPDTGGSATGARVPSAPGAPGGARQASPSAQQEQGFVPWSRFVSANQDVSNREAGKLQSQVQGDVDRAVGARDAASAAQADSIKQNYQGYQPPQPAQKPQPPGRASADLQPAASSFGNSASSSARPWGSFIQGPPRPAAEREPAAAPAPQPGPGRRGQFPGGAVKQLPFGTLDADRLSTTIDNGQPTTKGTGITGAKDLESQLGADAWAKLLGDTEKAGQGAHALGSEAGVQGILQKQAVQPLAQDGMFDAALVSGAGGKGFQDLSGKYGGSQLTDALTGANKEAQNRWATLMADVERAGRARDKQISDATDAMNRTPGEPGAAPTENNGVTSTDWGDSHGSLGDYMNQNSLSGIHAASQDLDPVSKALQELGKAGVYQGETASEWFRNKWTGGTAGELGSPGGSVDDQNRTNAFRELEQEYGREAVEFLWNNMTQGVWDSTKGMNQGAVYRLFKQLLDGSIANGSVKKGGLDAPGKDSEVQSAGHTTGETANVNGETRTTTDEQETARTNAYRDGWGEEWDRQFYQDHNDNPERAK